MLNNVITSRNNNSDYHIAHRNACFTWNFKWKMNTWHKKEFFCQYKINGKE